MSIFGDLDTDDIPDNPFHVDPATYFATCSEAGYKEKDGTQSLVIKWTIDEPESEFHGQPVTEWYTMPDLEDKKWANLTPEEKRTLKYLMRRMRRAFDLTSEEARTVEPSDLVGKEAYITTVINSGKGTNAGKEFVNINDAVCQRILDEERDNDTTSSTLGV